MTLEEVYRDIRKYNDVVAEFVYSYESMAMESFPEGDHELWVTYSQECYEVLPQVIEILNKLNKKETNVNFKN